MIAFHRGLIGVAVHVVPMALEAQTRNECVDVCIPGECNILGEKGRNPLVLCQSKELVADI